MKKRARVLGSVIRSETECKTFVKTQLEEHNKILKNLARSQKHHPPQNVCSCYTKGVQKSYRFYLELSPIPQKTSKPARR